MTTVNGYEVLPCPFCGSENSLWQDENQWSKWIVCDACGATGPTDLGVSGAIEAWNTRKEIEIGK